MVKQFQICNKCVMDISDPDIVFNYQGICNHCQIWEKIEKKRKLYKTELPWIYYNLKKEKKEKKYDCLLGLSGGVDSSLCLHYLVENGIKPLTFSIDNGWNTKKSDENIMRLVEGLKVPFYRYTINLEVFANLQAAFVKSGIPNIEIPTDHILMAASYEMADKYGIKYIISGGNHATEGIMPASWSYSANDLRLIKSIYKKFFYKTLKNLPLCSLLKFNYYKWIKKIDIINLLDYYEYNREDAKKLLSNKYGWKDYGNKHEENIFTAWFQNYYLPMKFGYDKRKPHFSSLINSGQMTRQQAMEELKKPTIYYPLNIEKKVLIYSKRTHKDYSNNEFLFNLISKIIKILRKYGIVRR